MKVNGAFAFNHFFISCHGNYLNKIHLNCILSEFYLNEISTCM